VSVPWWGIIGTGSFKKANENESPQTTGLVHRKKERKQKRPRGHEKNGQTKKKKKPPNKKKKKKKKKKKHKTQPPKKPQRGGGGDERVPGKRDSMVMFKRWSNPVVEH